MTPLAHIIPPAGLFPNNATLPVLVYVQAFTGAEAAAGAVEKRFLANGWSGVWRDGIYAFHHYHSQAHEALGVYRGWVEVQLGGGGGGIFRLEKGDVVVLPAGVAHKKVASSADFGVVGAYPPGQVPDMKTGEPGERAAAERDIAALAHPVTDPVEGASGPLPRLYGAASSAT